MHALVTDHNSKHVPLGFSDSAAIPSFLDGNSEFLRRYVIKYISPSDNSCRTDNLIRTSEINPGIEPVRLTYLLS